MANGEADMKQILLENAYEAWKNAISYHDKIQNGYSSLEYQKGFVSSLHNSVELFLKQIMLNKNDHDVAWIGKVKSKEDAQLQLDYYNSKDLNEFFSNLSSCKLNKFYSIEFGNLINKIHNLITINETDKNDFTTALKSLQSLRNNETHFYINENNYLSEKQFCQLHNLMIVFFKSIISKIFNQDTLKDFSDTLKINLVVKFKQMEIMFNPIKAFSYRDALISNKTVHIIKKYLSGAHSKEYTALGTDDYLVLAVHIIKTEKIEDSIDDYITLIGLMIKYKLFWIDKKPAIIDSTSDEIAKKQEYTIKFDSAFNSD